MPNSIVVIGNIGATPNVMTRLVNGEEHRVTSFSLASNEYQSGPVTRWYQIDLWDNDQANIVPFLTSGRLIGVRGQLGVEQHGPTFHYRLRILKPDIMLLSTPRIQDAVPVEGDMVQEMPKDPRLHSLTEVVAPDSVATEENGSEDVNEEVNEVIVKPKKRGRK